jgi:hypothetical protein
MHVSDCPRCGQTVASDRDPHLIVEERIPRVCDTCLTRDREPQGERVRLFTPAPAVMPGQLGFGVSRENPGT